MAIVFECEKLKSDRVRKCCNDISINRIYDTLYNYKVHLSGPVWHYRYLTINRILNYEQRN